MNNEISTGQPFICTFRPLMWISALNDGWLLLWALKAGTYDGFMAFFGTADSIFIAVWQLYYYEILPLKVI